MLGAPEAFGHSPKLCGILSVTSRAVWKPFAM